MTSLGMRHLALTVRDAQASKRFYTELLDMSVEWEPDPKNIYLTSAQQDNLALHEAEANRPVVISGIEHFGFFVRTPEAVDSWHERIVAAGTPIVAPPKTHRDGARSFYFRDPDGYVIQILFHLPIIAGAQRLAR